MAYDDERVKLSRIPNNLVQITMVHCSLTFGSGLCVATGEPCYQTYRTCKDKSHFGMEAGSATVDGTSVFWEDDFSTLDPSWIIQPGDIDATFSLDASGYTGNALQMRLATAGVETAVAMNYTLPTPLDVGATYTIHARFKAPTTGAVFQIGVGQALVAWTTFTTIAITTTDWATISKAITGDANSQDIIMGRLTSSTGYMLVDDIRITGGTCATVSTWSAYSTASYKVYEYVNNDAPLPLKRGERPYIKSVDYLPTEIKNELAVKGRINIVMYDEPDNDYTLDPNYSARAATSTTKASGKSYFKKFFSRYDNWYNSPVEVYEGFSVATNLSTDNFKRKFTGKMKSVEIDGNEVKIEAVDILDDLSGVMIPEKSDIRIGSITAGGLTLKIRHGIEDISTGSGIVRVEDELMHYSAVDVAKRRITLDERGGFYTDAKAHTKDGALQECRYFVGSPFDIMTTLLTSVAEIPATSVDTAAFTRMKTFPGREPYVMTVITEPLQAEDLYKELLRLTECRSWVNESQQITIGRGFAKNTTYQSPELSDSANIVEGSETVQYVNDNQLTRGILYWDGHVHADEDTGGEWTKIKRWKRKGLSSAYWVGFNQISEHTDTLAESTMYRGERTEEVMYTRWLHTTLSYPSSNLSWMGLSATDISTVSTDAGMYNPDDARVFADGMIRRYVAWRAQPRLNYKFDVEMKDSTIQVGDQILISGDLFLDATGANVSKQRCFVNKKEPQDDFTQTLEVTDYGAWTALIAPDTQVIYASAASSELQYGFISDTNNRLPDGREGYAVY